MYADTIAHKFYNLSFQYGKLEGEGGGGRGGRGGRRRMCHTGSDQNLRVERLSV